jgi:hypothetical protein
MHATQQAAGLPEGGQVGQVLTKTGPNDEDADWRDPPPDEMSPEQIAQSIDKGVTAMRFDFVALVDSTISI